MRRLPFRSGRGSRTSTFFKFDDHLPAFWKSSCTTAQTRSAGASISTLSLMAATSPEIYRSSQVGQGPRVPSQGFELQIAAGDRTGAGLGVAAKAGVARGGTHLQMPEHSGRAP